MPASLEVVFYDGHCALCHGVVRFALRHDRSGGGAFQFAPLQGRTFAKRVPAERRAQLPDSLIVVTAGGEILERSDAFLHICRQLGGFWRGLAAVLRIVPRTLRDAVYNLVARIRYRIFGRKDDLCPVVPPELRPRFLP